jgi:hypothetical protein
MSGSLSGSATDYLEAAAVSHVLGITALAMPIAIYVGLCATAPPPTDATGGAEPGATGGYVRVQATFALGSGVTPTTATNSAIVQFPVATADWGALGYFELWDAASAGNRLFYGTLVDPSTGAASPRTILNGDQARFAPGTLAVSCD